MVSLSHSLISDPCSPQLPQSNPIDDMRCSGRQSDQEIGLTENSGICCHSCGKPWSLPNAVVVMSTKY